MRINVSHDFAEKHNFQILILVLKMFVLSFPSHRRFVNFVYTIPDRDIVMRTKRPAEYTFKFSKLFCCSDNIIIVCVCGVVRFNVLRRKFPHSLWPIYKIYNMCPCQLIYMPTKNILLLRLLQYSQLGKMHGENKKPDTLGTVGWPPL